MISNRSKYYIPQCVYGGSLCRTSSVIWKCWISNHIFKLDKGMYDLKQAPGAWYERPKNFLLENNFYNGKSQ